jgi:hypothetical protein
VIIFDTLQGKQRVHRESVTALELHHQVGRQLRISRLGGNTRGLPVATAPRPGSITGKVLALQANESLPSTPTL